MRIREEYSGHVRMASHRMGGAGTLNGISHQKLQECHRVRQDAMLHLQQQGNASNVINLGTGLPIVQAMVAIINVSEVSDRQPTQQHPQ